MVSKTCTLLQLVSDLVPLQEKMREEMAQKREEARLNRTEENRPLLKSTLDRFTSKSKS